MSFLKITNAFRLSENFINNLDQTDINNIEIQTHIVSGLVLLIVSEYEIHFEDLFNQRASKCGDTHVCNYIKKSLSNNFRSPDLSKINETLKRFDQSYQQQIIHYQSQNPQEKSAWDTLLQARHYIVHKHGNVQVTFNELKTIYTNSKGIINAVEQILGINQSQVST